MSPVARPGRPPARVASVIAVLAAMALPACTEVKKADEQHYSPAALAPIEGGEKGEVSVTLTKEGANRIGVATEQVGRQGGRRAIPYAALVYESDGEAFVYVNATGLTYERASIEIDRVSGGRVLLKKGPPPGAKVVTIGVAQIHGAELEYGEY